jgi:hypothetical protein
MPSDLRFKGTPQAPTNIAGPTGRLADWLQHLTLDAIPSDVQARAKHLILDGIACALVGAKLPWSRVAVETIMGFEGTGDRTIIGLPAERHLHSGFRTRRLPSAWTVAQCFGGGALAACLRRRTGSRAGR